MLICIECKTEILEGTDAAIKGVCIPCSENRSLFDDNARNIRKFQKHLDAQYIEIERISQSKQNVDYLVTSALWDIDPRFRSRNIKAGSASCILRINKSTGKITVVYPLAFDESGRILSRAKQALNKTYDNGEFPEKICWASG